MTTPPLRPACLSLAVLLSAVLPGCAGDTPADSGADTGPPPATSGTLRTLTYNVHGLPSVITGDDTPARIEAIAPLLPPFELIGLQEDFDAELHATLIAQAEHPVQEWFDETVADDRVYGSGLALLAPGAALEVDEQHYDDCNGVTDGASDCLASKGWQRIRLQLGAAVIDVYNTHMEAGGGEADDAARTAQVDALLAALATTSADTAVIFMGDTNLHDTDPEDLVEVERLKAAGLRDACDEVSCAEPGRIDRVMVRDGGGVTLTVDAWQVAEGFVDADGVPLSDHDPIEVQLSWTVADAATE